MTVIPVLIIFAITRFAMVCPVQAPEVLTIEDSRPLMAAIHILEAKYGWRINYEDPPYTNPQDLVDHTHPSYRGSHKAISPRGGRLEIRYSVSPGTGKPESPEILLQQLIDDHARRGNPGHFQLKVIAGMPSVVPAQGAILDTPITLVDKPRTFNETVQEIVQALSSASGIRVSGPAITRPNFMRFSLSAENEPARDVLLRLFEMRKDRQYSWRLLYGPGWGYALNISSKSKTSQ